MVANDMLIKIISAVYDSHVPTEYVLRTSDILHHEIFHSKKPVEEELADGFNWVISDFNNAVLNQFEGRVEPIYDDVVLTLAETLQQVTSQDYVSIYTRLTNEQLTSKQFDSKNLYFSTFKEEDSFVANVPLNFAARQFLKTKVCNVKGKVPKLKKVEVKPVQAAPAESAEQQPALGKRVLRFPGILRGATKKKSSNSTTEEFKAPARETPENPAPVARDEPEVRPEQHVERPKPDAQFTSGLAHLRRRCEQGIVEGDLDKIKVTSGLPVPSKVLEKRDSLPIPDAYVQLISGETTAELISICLGMKLEKNHRIVREEDIAGLDNVKRLFRIKVIQPILHPHLHVGLLKPPRGVLLFGPPGTGKTTIAKWLAHVSGANFFEVSPSSITSKFHGESESIIKSLFKVAAFDHPSIIFVDEVDALLGQRTTIEGDATIRMKNQMLQMMDGLNNAEDTTVVVVAATNRPHALDDAALRRFSKRILVPLPDFNTRRQFIHDVLTKNANGGCTLSPAELEQVANATNGWNGSDILALCTRAAEYSYDDTLAEYGGIDKVPNVNVFRNITLNDFTNALQSVRPSSTSDPEAYIEWDRLHGSH